MADHFSDSVSQNKNENVGLVFLELRPTCENGFKCEKKRTSGAPGKRQKFVFLLLVTPTDFDNVK